MRVACIQLNAGKDWKKNWLQTQRQLLKAAQAGAHIALLPENFLARTTESETSRMAADIVPFVLNELKKISKKNQLTIVAGSVPEALPRVKSRKTANTCFVISGQGKQILDYRKMHLFDVNLPNVRVQESRSVHAGKQPGFFKSQGVLSGVGICYDLRFPEYFRILAGRGAEIFFVPANFTAETGKTAWEVLLRARAIENQCYVVAAGQWGRHPVTGIMSYGNSMIIDPKGQIMERAGYSKSEVLMADLDLKYLRGYRKRFPVLKHRKIGFSGGI